MKIVTHNQMYDAYRAYVRESSYVATVSTAAGSDYVVRDVHLADGSFIRFHFYYGIIATYEIHASGGEAIERFICES